MTKTISYDGQSLIVGGRRVWLVSGSIHYARTPHQQWRQRIRAAKQTGLNCIDTYVFWNLHEPRPGVFDFKDDRNLKRFVEIIGEEGMYCILRPGPYVGGQWDFGGLPAWLHTIEGIELRQENGPFFEACARYLGAVLEEVKTLQVNSRRSGPIIAMQAENRWFSTIRKPLKPIKSKQTYLVEIARYIRENGCTVPILECNNLWAGTDGAIGCWSGSQHLAADLRQLGIIQPDAPRIVAEYEAGSPTHWGDKNNRHDDAPTHLKRLASILATGAQYNISTFHGGTNFGFSAGRSARSPFSFATTSHDPASPLGESGERGPKYLATKTYQRIRRSVRPALRRTQLGTSSCRDCR